MTPRDEAIIRKARLLLTKRDVEVAALGFRFIEDLEHGYGPFWDGTESEIVNAQGWLAMVLSGASPSEQVTTHVVVPPRGELNGYEYDKQHFRVLRPPYGAANQDVHSDRWVGFDEGKEYEGLNLDDDCAVAELIAACSYAYQWYSADHDGEMLEDNDRKVYADKFKALGLTKEGCALRIEGLDEIYTRALKGKHDRNETLWC